MRHRLLGLLVGATLVAAACAPGTPSSPPTASGGATSPPASGESPAPSGTASGAIDLFGTDYAPEDGVDGGALIIGDWQEANLFHPFYLSQQTEANIVSATWATLVVFTADYKYAPDLAVDVPTLDNGGVTVPGDGGDAMTVTWTLRDGLTWSDGEPLTCDDFRYAWEWVLDPGNTGVVTSGFEEIEDFECASDTEMVLHYNAIYEGYITTQVAPLPRHYLESIPIADQVSGAGFRPDEIANLPVSGAFKFESVTPQSETRLVRNANYRSWKTGKPAHLDQLIFKWYGDADLMIAGYKAGEIDIATDLQDSDMPKVADLGDQVSAIPALTYELLRPNWSPDTCSLNPAVVDRGEGCPTSDPAFREAVAFAIDKNEINNRLLGGVVQVANTAITPDAWFYADQTPTTYDPEKARSILEEAGWTDDDGDGVREKDGLRAKVELCTTTRQVRVDTLALIANWLKDVGIEAISNPVDATAIFAAYNESTRETPCVLRWSNFDLAVHAFTSSIDPLGNYFNYHSSQFDPIGVNDAQVSDPAIDAALDTVKNSVDFAVIKNAMAEFQQVYVEKTVEIPLYYRQNVDLHAPKVGNFVGNPTQAGPTWNAVDWYVAE